MHMMIMFINDPFTTFFIWLVGKQQILTYFLYVLNYRMFLVTVAFVCLLSIHCACVMKGNEYVVIQGAAKKYSKLIQ